MSERSEARWQALFEALKEFLAREQRYPKKAEDPRLYTWCAVQRLKRKSGELDEEKILLLDSLNFIWNIQDHIWEQNFASLQKFRLRHPDRWPSQRSRDLEEHHLAVWFLGIRKDFKSGKLSKDRIERLEKIDFPFYPRADRWERTCQKVELWIARHGAFPQRNSLSSEEKKLHNWLRYQVTKMDFDVLTPEQCRRLSDLGIARFRALL